MVVDPRAPMTPAAIALNLPALRGFGQRCRRTSSARKAGVSSQRREPRVTAEWNASDSPDFGDSPAKRPIPAPKIGSSLRELPFAAPSNPHPNRKSVGQGMGQRPAREKSQATTQQKQSAIVQAIRVMGAAGFEPASSRV